MYLLIDISTDEMFHNMLFETFFDCKTRQSIRDVVPKVGALA